MNETTLTKSSQLAENLAASVLLNQFLKEVDDFGIHERREALQHIAVLILAAQPPIEA